MGDEFNSDVLAGMTLSRLYELARERDIRNPRKYKKKELIEQILAGEKPAAEEEGESQAAAGSAADNGEPEDRQSGEGEKSSIYGEDFVPPSRQEEQESDYIEDEPGAQPDGDGDGDASSRYAERTAYPSSSIGGSRSARRQSRYDDRRGTRGGRREDRNGLSTGASKDLEHSKLAKGVVEIIEDANYGFIRQKAFHLGEDDIYVSMSQIKKFSLRTGDVVEGYVRQPREQERYQSLVKIERINGEKFEEATRRVSFEKLTPVYPDKRLLLETEPKEISNRLIDLFAPIGRGTRGIIVAKPKAGKTIMLKKIAHAIAENHQDVELIALLIDERPEEVTHFRRNVDAEVFASSNDRSMEEHIELAELTMAHARTELECGRNLVILVDSLTRLTRAFNLKGGGSRRTLSGGVDAGALEVPRRLLGLARKIEGGGSVTILATTLIATGSRMDDLIFEEFKGTGNSEIVLSRELAEARIFPAIDIPASGTRKEELLYSDEEMLRLVKLRRWLAGGTPRAALNGLLKLIDRTQNNRELLARIQIDAS
jgi:transcription termination factor Rho